MNFLKNERVKDVFITIFVGACIAFITTFLEGSLEYFQGLENNTAGGVVGSLMYALRHLT